MQILFALLLGLNSLVADDWTWLEGEDAVDRETTGHPWYDQVNLREFSGGDFVSHFLMINHKAALNTNSTCRNRAIAFSGCAAIRCSRELTFN